MAYLQHDVEGQQCEDNEFVAVKQATACVVEHHICAGVKQRLQANLQIITPLFSGDMVAIRGSSDMHVSRGKETMTL